MRSALFIVTALMLTLIGIAAWQIDQQDQRIHALEDNAIVVVTEVR